MLKDELPYWLQDLTLRGREDDEGEEDGDEGDDDGDDGEEGEEEGEEGSGDDGNEDPGDDPVKLKEKLAAKEAALRKERKLRREAEREARKKTRKRTQSKQTKEDTEQQDKLRASEERLARLSEGYLSSAIDTALERAARKAGFIDPTDALLDSVRREVDYEQDEEDPSDIDIDADSVKDAIEDLIARKPHLLGKSGSGDEERSTTRSGGKFKKKSRSTDDLDEKSLRDKGYKI